MMHTKKWWKSRTLWVNALAFAALMLQSMTGEMILSPESQAAIIVLLNLVLRLITKSGLDK